MIKATVQKKFVVKLFKKVYFTLKNDFFLTPSRFSLHGDHIITKTCLKSPTIVTYLIFIYYKSPHNIIDTFKVAQQQV